jgi:hypothetical protein
MTDKSGNLAQKRMAEWLSKLTIRKGMVLVRSPSNVAPQAVYMFEAEFKFLEVEGNAKKEIELLPFYEPVLTSSTFRQTCVLVEDPRQRPNEGPISISFSKKLEPKVCDDETKQNFLEITPIEETVTGGELSDYEALLYLKKTRSKTRDYPEAKQISLDQSPEQKDQKKKKKFVEKKLVEEILKKRGIPQQLLKTHKMKIPPGKPFTLMIQFKYHPEFIQEGFQVLINDEKLKAFGRVTKTWSI